MTTARADIVGSLIRSPYLHAARQAVREGRAGAKEELRAIEDRAILDAMARRDVAGAVAAISRHLETARQHLIGAETTE